MNGTDWWLFGATLVSGFLTAMATIIAVVLTNKETRKQVADERIKTEKRAKFVVLFPSLLTIDFVHVLDRLLMNNEYNRVLLFSGEDGFECFDNPKKRAEYRQKILLIQNQTGNDIKNIIFTTKTELINSDTNQKMKYETSNQIKLIRSNESFMIRLENEEQFLAICEMNRAKVGSKLEFCCDIEYETLASQRIKYLYQINMYNDNNIEVIKDGIESVVDIDDEPEKEIKQTVFRNLQDFISSIDRSEYVWNKMATTQMMAAKTLFTQPVLTDECKDGK